MDIRLIVIASFIFLALVFLIIFLIKSINDKSFIADDGSVFENKSELDLYQSIYEKTKPIFSIAEDKDYSQSIQGFEKSFLTKIKSDGFQDLKTIIRYRKQFEKFSDLINT